MAPIQITIFTGFLGAGKTSIILSLLPQLPQGYRCVLLKNEFGDVEVDSQLARQSSLTAVSEILNGCMCCVLIGRMKHALQEIRESYNPDRIIIETSGSAFPAPLVLQVRELARETDGAFALDAVVTVVDCENFKGFEDTSPTAKMQAQFSDVILLNKWESLSEDALDRVLDHVYTLNDLTPKVKTNGRQGVSPSLVFNLDSKLAATADLSAFMQDATHNDEIGTVTVSRGPSKPAPHSHTHTKNSGCGPNCACASKSKTDAAPQSSSSPAPKGQACEICAPFGEACEMCSAWSKPAVPAATTTTTTKPAKVQPCDICAPLGEACETCAGPSRVVSPPAAASPPAPAAKPTPTKVAPCDICAPLGEACETCAGAQAHAQPAAPKPKPVVQPCDICAPLGVACETCSGAHVPPPPPPEPAQPQLTRAGLSAALWPLPKDSVYRVKGFIRLTDSKSVTRTFILNWAFGRFDLTPLESDSGALQKDCDVRLTVMGHPGEVRRYAVRFAEALGATVS